MNKEYEVLSFKVGDFKDQNGNTWCDMALAGIGEPVKIVVKDPSKFSIGMKLYGNIKDVEGKSGKTYHRFYRQQKPEPGNYSHQSNAGQKQPYDQDGQAWGNSVTNGTAIAIACDKTNDPMEVAKTALAIAQILYNGRNDRSMTMQNSGQASSSTNPGMSHEEIIALEASKDMDDEIDLSEIPF